MMGTLAVTATREGMKTVLVSGDKDLAQLVDENVVLMDTMKDITYDTTGVEQKFGVPPEKIVDFLALVGDTADNLSLIHI